MPLGETTVRRNTAVLMSFGLACLVLVAVWLTALESSPDGVTTFTGARDSFVTFIVLAVVAVSFQTVRVWSPRVLHLLPVFASVVFVFTAALLFMSDRLDTAFALYGGLQVSRSNKLFSDMHWILSWFECDFCSEWDPHYGATLKLLDPATGGLIGLGWLAALGIITVALAILALWLLAQSASSFGRWLFLAAALSPAWLLLLDRANSDAIILAAVVVGAWIVSRRPTLLTWSLFAGVLWILGTIKFYPFALGALLLFALRVKRGWIVLVTFLAATASYMAVSWDSYQRSSAWTLRPSLFEVDLSSYGRVYLEEAISLGSFSNTFTVVALYLLAFSGLWWGWESIASEGSATGNLFHGIVAFGGGIAFLGKVLWAGFGFAYTGAFLLLILPVCALASSRQKLFSGSSVAVGFLGVIAVFTPSNAILGTLSGLIVAGFGIGAGLKILWQQHYRTRTKTVDKNNLGESVKVNAVSESG